MHRALPASARAPSARIEWVDYCKGLAIFYVVFGHVLGGLEVGRIVGDSAGFRFTEHWLYSFHMPLFFLLAGMFVRRSARRSAPAFIIDKMAILVWPYLVWSLLQGLLQISHYGNHSLPPIALAEIVYLPIGQYWFLYTLFIMMMLYLAVIKLTASDTVFSPWQSCC